MIFKSLMDKIGYQFSNQEILKEALIHPSISYVKKYKNSYERLEFLGDTILSVIIAEMLFFQFPNEKEGDLSKRHIELVKGKTLAEVACKINLGEFIIMSQGEKNNNGASNKKNLEDAMEAIIGAIYIDGSFEQVKKVITKYWTPILLEMKSPPQNVKSSLQEWAQQNGLPKPEYRIIDQVGPSHSPIFSIEIFLQGFKPITVKAKSKSTGEQMAAKLMLESIL
ncbi:MAG: ribonuclease III [Rickettsiaceae bacterium H1]|nr:ribonuclease III [Rickettsiaceae bacterium H1]